MKSEQATVFGFPNPMLGLVAYGVVVAIGAGLLAGARPGTGSGWASTRERSSGSASAPG